MVLQDKAAVDDEIAALQRESEIPLDELMPVDYLDESAWPKGNDMDSGSSGSGSDESGSVTSTDEETDSSTTDSAVQSSGSSTPTESGSEDEMSSRSAHLSTKSLLDEDKACQYPIRVC